MPPPPRNRFDQTHVEVCGDRWRWEFTAQHPLLYGTRAKWYFEEGKHGGSINDIGVHAVTLVATDADGHPL